jgi:hypothetical protein
VQRSLPFAGLQKFSVVNQARTSPNVQQRVVKSRKQPSNTLFICFVHFFEVDHD